MLLALAALAIVVPAGVCALRSASIGAVEAHSALDRDRARLAAMTLGSALLAWADEQAEEIPLTPEEAETGVRRILDQPSPDGSRLVVDAIDLSGRLSIRQLGTLASSGLPSPLDQLRPEDVANLTSDDEVAPPLVPEALAWVVRDRTGQTLPAFPQLSPPSDSDGTAITLWLTANPADGPARGGASMRSNARGRPAAGADALNIRTAPIELLRAALVGYDPALARAALAARELGEPIPREIAGALIAASNSATAAGSESRGQRRTRLTARSDAYGFIISVERGALRESWWLVAARPPYIAPTNAVRGVNQAAGAAQGTPWRIIERRRIHP